MARHSRLPKFNHEDENPTPALSSRATPTESESSYDTLHAQVTPDAKLDWERLKGCAVA